MGRYDRAYGTDWDSLGRDEAIDRAYALGVAASLGEYHPDELDRIRAEMSSAYQKSVVDLAFEEGRNEARKYDAPEADDGEPVWADLVEGEKTTVDEDGTPTGGPLGLPEALDKLEALDRPEMDDRGAQELPDFLERD